MLDTAGLARLSPQVLHAPASGQPYLANDTWAWPAEGAVFNPEAPQVLTLDTWLGQSAPAGAPRALVLTGAGLPEALAGRLAGLSMIAVTFAAFADGRGFSVARYLRQQLQWSGELRAVGDVLVDTVNYLARCGFDSFQLKPGHDAQDALRQLQWFPQPYQRGYRALAGAQAA